MHKLESSHFVGESTIQNQYGCLLFLAKRLLILNAFRMDVSMPCIQPHQYILMQNMQQMRLGHSRLMTTFRELKFFEVKKLFM